ncbi:hypothetical protein O181_014784 [Austropuccinia psidii MF-1]|uniref:Uncharacterized protein n=1 Tax=Austropuccinia psidii MF-1 TaxID=1389203 RepID=A0A9Q3C0R3_9BASI|nr:hypothetical protein [Austropuccinia psidii MF-1]
MTTGYKEGKGHTNEDGLSRWPLNNDQAISAYYLEKRAKIPIQYMEIDRKRNFELSIWALYNDPTNPEQSFEEYEEVAILGIRSSNLNTEFLKLVY